MLPIKIRDLLISLREKSESGELSWNYEDEDTIVTLDLQYFHISINYSFNTVEEVGQFRIIYFDKETQKEYYFSTNENYSDYEVTKKLFDSAQASNLNIRF